MSGRAKFVHWLAPFEDIDGAPMFNVIENNIGMPNGSTVGGETLLKVYGIPVPLFPDYGTWCTLTDEKKRCFRCWAALKGTRADYQHHHETNHGERKAYYDRAI